MVHNGEIDNYEPISQFSTVFKSRLLLCRHNAFLDMANGELSPHADAFCRLSQQTTFENTVAKGFELDYFIFKY